MFTLNNQTIASLDELNTALQDLNPVSGTATHPLTTAMFDATGNPTPAEIDQAIATYTGSVYDYFDLDGEVAEINQHLSAIVADPAEYTRVTNAGLSAYISTRYDIGDAALALLVSAAHNIGDARHQTALSNGVDYGDGYVHCPGNQLYGFEDTGSHRGDPMVLVVANGTVNAGSHNFGRW
jgi:hypothetical protein